MESRPLTPRLGSVITGVDLGGHLDEALAAALRVALLERGVLVFPGQHHLDRPGHVALARVFGDVLRQPNGLASQPEVVRIEHGPAAPPTENIWHMDLSFLPTPPRGAVLRAVVIPEVGGDTLFADMRAVVDELPASVRSALQGLSAVHDIAKWIEGDKAEELRAAAPPVEHPVVRIHPESGRPVLNVNRAYTTGICGAEGDPSGDQLLEFLLSRITIPEVQCRIRWQPGHVVVWDNRAVQHYAVGDYYPARRIMERIAITGDEASGRRAEQLSVSAQR